MRVLMPILEYHPITGGAQRQLAALAPHLAAAGVQLEVWTRAVPGLPAFETVSGVAVRRLGRAGAGAAASFLAAAAARLPRTRPDLVHAYSLFSPAAVALLAKRALGVPIAVKVLRGGALGDLERLRRKRLGRSRAAALARHVDCFVTISDEIDAELAQLGVPPERRRFVPNGVDTERFRPADAPARAALRAQLGLPEGPLAVYCGRLVPEKRVDALLAAWRRVCRSHPDAHLLVLGDGPDARSLRTAAGPRVVFRGDVSEVAPHLRAADLFVLPSRTEGLSNALLEAMASGLAVVATEVGGAREVLGEGACGRLVPAGDGDALALALDSLLADGAARERLGRAARERARDAYALSETAASLVSLYHELTAAPRRGATRTLVTSTGPHPARRSCHG